MNKKSSPKKLTLSRETLSNLNDQQLTQANGGTLTIALCSLVLCTYLGGCF